MNQFCRVCGNKLVQVLTGTTYDPDTGKPVQWYTFPCPKYRWWAPWTWSHRGPNHPRSDSYF